MKENYFIAFIVNEFYFLQIYEYLAKLLAKENQRVLFLLEKEHPRRSESRNKKTLKIEEDFFRRNNFDYDYLNADLSHLSTTYIVCATHHYHHYKNINFKYSVLMTHGIGTKKGYFNEDNTNYDIQFCEGSYRKEKLEELFPQAKTQFINVGFAKLDAAVNISTQEKNELIEKYKLDSNKKTILYSPTFYPSSIEKIKRRFPDDFKDYNIIIKPHFFSYELKRYARQRLILKHWNQYHNVYLAKADEFNLVPFMAVADVMITDESSAMFEFTALDKPVICYRNVKLRLSYLLNKNKLKRRMDPFIAQFNSYFRNVYTYSELRPFIDECIANPDADKEKRKEITDKLVGKTDGNVCQRIVKTLLDFSSQA